MSKKVDRPRRLKAVATSPGHVRVLDEHGVVELTNPQDVEGAARLLTRYFEDVVWKHHGGDR